MITFLTLLLGLCLIVTLGILIVGLVGMVRPEFNDKYGNKIMRYRIMSQLVTALVFLLLILVRTTA